MLYSAQLEMKRNLTAIATETCSCRCPSRNDLCIFDFEAACTESTRYKLAMHI
jgi:hypothetical protein